jgi:hypothetical protein
MSNTLAEYATLCTDALKKGIANTIVVDDPLLGGERALRFQPIGSNSIKYNMQTVAAGADFYNVGDPIVESPPTWEARNADLAILMGDADVDNFAVATGMVSAADIIALKAKDIANRWANAAVLGQTTTNTTYSPSKVFKGLLRLLAECESATTTDLDAVNNSQLFVGSASASAVITLDYLSQLRDMIKGGKATHFMTSYRMCRKIEALARAAGSNLRHDNDALGYPVTRFGDQFLIASDAVPDNMPDPSSSVTAIATYTTTTTRAAANDITPVFAFRIGEAGLMGITSREAGMIQTEDIGPVQNKDARRTRIKFYCGLALFNKLALAGALGFTDA